MNQTDFCLETFSSFNGSAPWISALLHKGQCEGKWLRSSHRNMWNTIFWKYYCCNFSNHQALFAWARLLAIASKSKAQNWHRGPLVFGRSLSGRSAGHHKRHVLGQDGLIKTRSGGWTTGTQCTEKVTSALLRGGRDLVHRLAWEANTRSRQTLHLIGTQRAQQSRTFSYV